MKTRRQRRAAPSPIRNQALVAAGRLMLVVASAALLAAVLIVWRLLAAGQEILPSGALGPPAPEDETVAASSDAPAPPPPVDVPPGAPRVGVVAGHAGFDIGAVCPDGLTEAEVNLVIAREVAVLLSRRGYYVDLMDEYDDRLTGYSADALVSVHADSCDVPGATGFKVARVTNSAIPEDEDRLVDCLYEAYQGVTDLPRHPSSITDDMTSYHAFREIDYYTPGAIIETGFLLDDRDLLTKRPKQVARGIAAGVVCFVEDSR
jgi:N-acetylmuramoyl-L-alanine amidase